MKSTGFIPGRASGVAASEEGEWCAFAAYACLPGPGDREPHLLGTNHVRTYFGGTLFAS